MKNFYRIMDKKQYELKDHLGNVRATIGDYKMPQNDAFGTRGVAPFFVDEKSVSDFYPFGMSISDRSFSSASYRYGFNGQEKDNEVKGINGSQLDFGARIYDSRLARWMSRDPLSIKYQFLSPYAFVANKPIIAFDIGGNDLFYGNKLYIVRDIVTAALKTRTGSSEYEKIFLGTGSENIFMNYYPEGSNPIKFNYLFFSLENRDRHLASTVNHLFCDNVSFNALSENMSGRFSNWMDFSTEIIASCEAHLINFDTEFFNYKYIFGSYSRAKEIKKPSDINQVEINRLRNLVFAWMHEVDAHIIGTLFGKSDPEHENFGNSYINYGNSFEDNRSLMFNSRAIDIYNQVSKLSDNFLQNIIFNGFQNDADFISASTENRVAGDGPLDTPLEPVNKKVE